MVPNQSPSATKKTSIRHWSIVNGPSQWDFVFCCVDPYPTPGVRRTVQFTVKDDFTGCTNTANAHITTLHVPSLDTWRFEADMEGTWWGDDGAESVVWRHVCGQYSTKTRTGFFCYEEYAEKKS